MLLHGSLSQACYNYSVFAITGCQLTVKDMVHALLKLLMIKLYSQFLQKGSNAHNLLYFLLRRAL